MLTASHESNPELDLPHSSQTPPASTILPRGSSDHELLRHARGLYGITEAAEWLSVSPDMVRKLTRCGELAAVKVGTPSVMKAVELDRYVDPVTERTT